MSEQQLNTTNHADLMTESVIIMPAAKSETNSSLQVGASITLSLFIVISVIVLFGWLLKRCGWKKRTDHLISIKASYAINAKQRIMLVHIDKQLLVIGVSPQQMTLLHTINETRTQELLSSDHEIKLSEINHTFQQMLQSTLKRSKTGSDV